MKAKAMIFILACLMAGLVNAKEYKYSVNLNNVEKDKLLVELICPKIEKSEVVFNFPAMIPGHYSKLDLGRFVSKFRAFNSDGKLLKTKKLGENSYLITSANELSKITYTVDDTKDHKQGKKIHSASATNFQHDKVFVFNNGGIFGYFNEMGDLPIVLSIKKPKNFYGVTSLKQLEANKEEQKFRAESYTQLVDCPILFSEPDTTSFKSGQTEFIIGVYNETGEKIAKSVYEEILPYVNAVQDFVGGNLPLKKYAFLIYLSDATEFKEAIYGNEKLTIFQKIKFMTAPPIGALEHKSSSLYCYFNIGKAESYMYYIKRTITHEIMHVYTPLRLRSQIVDNFNYANPEMSQHLWLYEGVTDYFSWQLKMRSNLITLGEFLGNELRGKMFKSRRFQKEIPFTEWSRRITEKEFKKQFGQVYSRGTILAMLLDFEIMRLTEGEKSLRSVIFELCNKYGEGKPFNENRIFDEFVDLVHPSLVDFFDKYIEGKEELDYKTGFNTVGVDFHEKIEGTFPISILSHAYGVENLIERIRMYSILQVAPGSPFEVGDKIKYNDFGENCLKPFIADNGEFVEEGTIVTVPIIRDGKEIELELKTESEHRPYYYMLSEMKQKNKLQEKCFKLWLN